MFLRADRGNPGEHATCFDFRETKLEGPVAVVNARARKVIVHRIQGQCLCRGNSTPSHQGWWQNTACPVRGPQERSLENSLLLCRTREKASPPSCCYLLLKEQSHQTLTQRNRGVALGLPRSPAWRWKISRDACRFQRMPWCGTSLGLFKHTVFDST